MIGHFISPDLAMPTARRRSRENEALIPSRVSLSPSQVVAQALGLALTIGLAVAVCVQLLGPKVLVHLAGEKSKEVMYY